tara:strand:+ start:2409 stop:3035 length:627 start_codon:yes stop_codon:yes gene_type:complete
MTSCPHYKTRIAVVGFEPGRVVLCSVCDSEMRILPGKELVAVQSLDAEVSECNERTDADVKSTCTTSRRTLPPIAVMIVAASTVLLAFLVPMLMATAGGLNPLLGVVFLWSVVWHPAVAILLVRGLEWARTVQRWVLGIDLVLIASSIMLAWPQFDVMSGDAGSDDRGGHILVLLVLTLLACALFSLLNTPRAKAWLHPASLRARDTE